MKQLLIILTISCLASCASLDAAKSAQLAHIKTLQKEVQTLSLDKTGAAAYAPTKAMAWLDLALDEYYDEDQSGITAGAITEAEKIISALKSNTDVLSAGLETPLIAGSEKIRDDLWKKSASLKKNTHYACGAKELAELDVQLIWTGHEHWEAGWSHAKTSSEVADNLAFEAEQAIKQCEQLAEIATPTIHPSATSTVEVVVEKYNFSAEALFAFNQSRIEYLVLGGKHRLDKLINEINTWQQIDTIEVRGYADEIGSASYNQALSQARANTVRDYMNLHGVKASITATGFGETESISDCPAKQTRDKRISCLQGDRRVELVVRGKH